MESMNQSNSHGNDSKATTTIVTVTKQLKRNRQQQQPSNSHGNDSKATHIEHNGNEINSKATCTARIAATITTAKQFTYTPTTATRTVKTAAAATATTIAKQLTGRQQQQSNSHTRQ